MSEGRSPRYSWKSDVARLIARLAAGQGGHVRRKQLLALGLRKGAIDRHLEAGRLFQVHRGVYAVGHLPTNPLDRALSRITYDGLHLRPRAQLRRLNAILARR